jgi:Tfp pilus assembly protein PilZ
MPTDDDKADDFSVAGRLLRLIDSMSEEEQRLLLQELETRLQSREKRRHRRKPAFLVVDYAIDGRPYSDFIQDLSAGGVFIETCMSIPVGTDLVITFRDPDHETGAHIPGKVVRVSPQGVGVRFQPLDSLQGRVIRAYLNKF